jgi:translation elongation factor aEF-1 beta
MTVVAVKLKIMPDSPETNLKIVEEKLKVILGTEGVQNSQFETQPIAFGLNALIVMFGWPEDKELEDLEEKLKAIEGISSVQLLDIRRAIG